MTSLQIQVLATQYVPDNDPRLDGVQVVVALVEGDGVPAPFQVWDEPPSSRPPWTVQSVTAAGVARIGVVITRPASEQEPLLEPGQLVDLVQLPGAVAGDDWLYRYTRPVHSATQCSGVRQPAAFPPSGGQVRPGRHNRRRLWTAFALPRKTAPGTREIQPPGVAP